MPKKSASSGTPGKDKGKEETIGVFETPTKSDDETSVSPVIEIVDSIFAGEDEMQEDLHIISLDEAVRMKRWMEICKVFPRKQPVNDNHTEEHRRSVALSSARNVRDIIQGSRLNGKFWGGLTYDTCKRVEAVYDEFEGEVGDARDFHLAPMSTTILPRETVEMIENLHANLVREWSEYARVARDAGSTFKRSLGYNPGKPVRVMGTKQLVWCQVEFYIKLARFLEREDRYTPHNFISYLLEIFDETWKAYPNLGLNELLKRTFWWIPESVFVVLSKPKDRHKLLYEITKKAPLWREAWRERSWKNGDPDTFPEWGEVLRELLKSANAGKAQNPRVGGKRDQEEPDSSGDNNRTGKHRTEKGVKPGQEKHRGSDGDKSNTGAAKSKTIDDEKFVKFANRLHNGQCVGCGAVDHPLRECKGADPEAGTFLRLRQAEPSKYRERLDRLVPLTDEERAAKRSAKGETVKSGKDQAERSNKERGMVKSMNFVATVRETEIKTVLQKRLLIYPKNVTDERHGMPVETLFDRCTFMAKRPVKKGERLDETNTQHGAISAELAKRLGANINPYENEIEGRGASEKRRFKVSNWTGEHIDVYVEGWATFAMAAVMQEGDTTILREFQVDLDVVEGMGIGGAQVILGYRFHKEQDDIAEAGGHPIKDDTVIDVPPADFATTVSEKVEEKPSDEDYGEDERTIPAYGGDDGELDVEGRDELHQIGKETFESRYESVRMHVSLHKANEAVQRLSDRVLEAFTVLDGYIKQGAIPPPEILSVVAFGHADFWNLTPKNAMDLFQICQDYGHIFRVKQIPNEGYRVDPARDELIATYQPRGHHNIYGDKRTLDKQRAIMEEKVANGEWEKTTKSVACLSPVFLVDNKGTKKSRLVCDSRTANEMVKPIDHPTEEIRMQLEMMSDAAGHYDVDRTKNDPYLCVTDGHKAFDNVPYVDEKGIYATRIGPDVYVPKRIPTGSRNAPAHLNRAMHQVFKGMVYKDVFHYVDDMFFGGRTQEDTISRLKRFFERCSEMNVGLKLEGSQFLRKNILAAGYHIEVRKDNSIAWTKYPRRMVDLIQFDTPKTCDEVAWLLFISNYVREHIPNYDGLVEPLRQYLDGKPKTTKEQKKIVVAENEWGDPQRQALETLKRACGRQLSLSAPRPDYMFAVICDASQFGHGSLLVQFPPEQSEWDFGERDYTVIATHSGRFNTEEKKRHIRQKEWQACVCALKAYEKFLRGAKGPLLIYTDHQSLVSLNLPDYKSVAVHDRLLRWNTLIVDFRPIIRHVPLGQEYTVSIISKGFSIRLYRRR